MRDGYTFDGWYEDPECTIPFYFGSQLSASKTLYAGWKGTYAQYTVIYWGQQANILSGESERKYDYVTTTTRWASTGTAFSEIDADDYQNLPRGTEIDNISASSYFHYNSEKTAAANRDVTIAGDGSTVINVYYDRNVYTLAFNLNTDSSRISMTIGGKTYTGGRNAEKYSFQARVGEDIADRWPTGDNFTEIGRAHV